MKLRLSLIVLVALVAPFVMLGRTGASATGQSAAVGTIATIAGGGSGGVGSPALQGAIKALDLTLGPDGTVFFTNITCPEALRNGAIASAGQAGCSPDDALPYGAAGSLFGIAVDSDSNVYAADWNRCRIWRFEALTGAATIMAGSHNNNSCSGPSDDNVPATSTNVGELTSVAVAPNGDIYLSDERCQVRRVSSGVVVTIAGVEVASGTCVDDGTEGQATSVHLGAITSLELDSDGSLNIAAGCRIRKLQLGALTTVEGMNCAYGFEGPSIAPNSPDPYKLTVGHRHELYFSDAHCRIFRLERGLLTVIAGHPAGICGYAGDGGPARGASLRDVTGLAMDAAGNLYFSEIGDDYATSHIRVVYGAADMIVGPPGVLDTYAGAGGIVPMAADVVPYRLALGPGGELTIGELGCGILAVRDGAIVPVAGQRDQCQYDGDGGLALNAHLTARPGIAYDAAGNLYVGERFNCTVRMVDAATGVISTVAGVPYANAWCDDGADVEPIAALSAQLEVPGDVAVAPDGDLLIAESDGCTVRRMHAGQITTIAGIRSNQVCVDTGDNGPATMARLADVNSVAVDPSGDIYISTWGCRIRKVSGGIITTIAGTGTCGYNGDGPATKRQLDGPYGLAVDEDGRVFISDMQNCRVRMVRDGFLLTLAGGGTIDHTPGGCGPASLIQEPAGLAIDKFGNLYFAELDARTLTNNIRVIYGAAIDTDGDGLTDGEEGIDTIASLYCRVGRADVIPDGIVNSGDQLKVAYKIVHPTVRPREDQNADGVVNSGDQVFVASVFGQRSAQCRG